MEGLVRHTTAAVLVAALAGAVGCDSRPAELAPRVGRLDCVAGRTPTHWAHIELFVRGRVVLLPAGVGIAPPVRQDGAYVRGGRCRYPVWTDEPTGLIAVTGDRRLRDLAALWTPLLAGRVRAFVGGRRWRGDPGAIPLRRHAQIVLESGRPLVAPHATYRFPAGR